MEDKFLVITVYGTEKIIDEHSNHKEAWDDYKNEVKDAEDGKRFNVPSKVYIAKIMESFNTEEEE